MARNIEFGKLWGDLYTSPRFCAYNHPPKVLFTVLISPGQCDHAGLFPLTVRRWLPAMNPSPEREIRAALAALEDGTDVYIDEDTEEGLVREFMFRDKIWKQPTTVISAMKSAATVRSPKLAALLISEIERIEPIVKEPSTAKLAGELAEAIAAAKRHCRDRAALLPVGPSGGPSGGGSDEPSDPAPELAVDEAVFGPSGGGSVVVEVGVISPSVLTPIDEKDHYTRPSYVGQPVAESSQKSPGRVHDGSGPLQAGRDPDRPPPPTLTVVPDPAPLLPACGPACASAPCGRCADRARDRIHAGAEAIADLAACRLCDDRGHRHEPPEVASWSNLPLVRCDHSPYTLEDWRREIRPPNARVNPCPPHLRTPTLPATAGNSHRTITPRKRAAHGNTHVSRRRNDSAALAS